MLDVQKLISTNGIQHHQPEKDIPNGNNAAKSAIAIDPSKRRKSSRKTFTKPKKQDAQIRSPCALKPLGMQLVAFGSLTMSLPPWLY